MIICFYVRLILIESYYRIKEYLDKIKHVFKKKEEEDTPNSNIFSDIRYNPFKDSEENNTNIYRQVPEIVVTQPEINETEKNIIDNWDIIDN